MTQAAYARHRGVSKQAVNKLVQAGKLPPEAFVERNGQRLIDPAAADLALGEVRERINVGGDDAAPADPTFGSNAGSAPQGGAGTVRLTQAKTATEIYTARIRQLEYEQRIGQLRPVAEIEAAAVKCAEATVRVLADKLLRIDQLVSAGAKEGGPGVRKILNEIIFAERETITRAFAELASAEFAGRQPEQQVA